MPKLPWEKDKLPNETGKGGRPLGFQKDLTPAKEAIAAVREESPKTFQIPPRKGWEKDFNNREEEIERKEAEAVLAARQDRLAAIEQETAILRVNRALALRFSASALHLAEITEKTAISLKKKVSEGDLTLKEIKSILAITGTTIQKAQNAIGTMAKVERYISRHPLDDGGGEVDDLDGLDSEGAKQILINLNRSLTAAVRKIDPPQDTEVVEEDVPEDPDA